MRIPGWGFCQPWATSFPRTVTFPNGLLVPGSTPLPSWDGCFQSMTCFNIPPLAGSRVDLLKLRKISWVSDQSGGIPWQLAPEPHKDPEYFPSGLHGLDSSILGGWSRPVYRSLHTGRFQICKIGASSICRVHGLFVAGLFSGLVHLGGAILTFLWDMIEVHGCIVLSHSSCQESIILAWIRAFVSSVIHSALSPRSLISLILRWFGGSF